MKWVENAALTLTLTLSSVHSIWNNYWNLICKKKSKIKKVYALFKVSVEGVEFVGAEVDVNVDKESSGEEK